jgi:hypothetical protein
VETDDETETRKRGTETTAPIIISSDESRTDGVVEEAGSKQAIEDQCPISTEIENRAPYILDMIPQRSTSRRR